MQLLRPLDPTTCQTYLILSFAAVHFDDSPIIKRYDKYEIRWKNHVFKPKNRRINFTHQLKTF